MLKKLFCLIIIGFGIASMIWGLSSMAGDSFAWGSKYSQEGKDSAAVAFSLIIGFSCVLGGWLQLSIERS